VITGIVGAAGGLGGFFLPNLLGSLKQISGSYAGGFLIFSLTGFTCAVALVYVSRSWESLFVGHGGLAIFLPPRTQAHAACSTEID
jgi:NNP family nitrate/nitrite transporter-like MFS transporter